MMSAYIRDWLKIVLYTQILVIICSMLLKKSPFEKYVGLFTGFITLSCLIYPLLHLAGFQDRLDASWILSSLRNEFSVIRNEEISGDVEESLQTNYEQAIVRQIKQTGQSYQLNIENVNISWKENIDGIEYIKIEGTVERDVLEEGEKAGVSDVMTQEDIPDLQEFCLTICQLYHIDRDRLEIDVGS